MANEMKFRDELLARIIMHRNTAAVEHTIHRGAEVINIVEFVDEVAKEACKQWGHDEVEFYLNTAGSMTIARPAMEHRHYRCRRCGEELKQ